MTDKIIYSVTQKTNLENNPYNITKKYKGKIILYIGPMNANKTKRLIEKLDKGFHAKAKIIYVKHAHDTRYDDLNKAPNNAVISNDKQQYTKADLIKTEKLVDIYDILLQYDVIGIDEVQFYDDAPDIAEKLASAGKQVICAGLDGDFKRRPFDCMPALSSLADKVKKLQAVCVRCGDNAIFTHRTVAVEDKILIGNDEYESLCRICYEKAV